MPGLFLFSCAVFLCVYLPAVLSLLTAALRRMYRHAVNIFRRLHDSLRQRGMRMDQGAQFCGRNSPLNGQRAFVDHIGRMGAADMHPEHLIGLLVRDHLDHAGDLSHSMRLAESPVSKASDFYFQTVLQSLLLAKSHTSGLGHGENTCRNDRIVHADISPERILCGDETLVRSNMREHHSADHITDGIDTRNVRLHFIIHHDLAARSRSHAQRLEADIFRIHAAAYRDKYLLRFYLPAISKLREHHSVRDPLCFFHFNIREEPDLRFFEFALKDRRYLISLG